MRLAFDISQIIYGTGVSDYTYEIATRLSLNPDVDLVAFGYSFRRSNEFKSAIPSAHVLPLPPTFFEFIWNRFHFLKLESILGPVDIYHSSDWTQAPSSARKVTTVHDLSPFLFPNQMASGHLRNIVSVHQRKMHWVQKECDKIICVSTATASDLMRLFSISSSKIEVIPEALPARFASIPDKNQIERTLTKFNLKDTNFVTCIGTLQPRKNIPSLISAFTSYQNKLNLPDKLVIIGKPGWGDIPAHHPSVIFTGYVTDVELTCLLRQSEAFVYPSLYEGFGLPVLIAFHHQIPVVCSNISSLPEVAGDAAILVDPNSVKSIAQGIKVAVDSSKQLIPRGTKQLAKFNWDNIADQTYSVYKNLIR